MNSSPNNEMHRRNNRQQGVYNISATPRGKVQKQQVYNSIAAEVVEA